MGTFTTAVVVTRRTVAALRGLRNTMDHLADHDARQGKKPTLFRLRAKLPVDFGLHEITVEVPRRGEVVWGGTTLPEELLQDCLTRNVAYRVEAAFPLDAVIAKGEKTKKVVQAQLAVTPLFGYGDVVVPPPPCEQDTAAQPCPESLEPEPPAFLKVAEPAEQTEEGEEEDGITVGCRGPVLWVNGQKMHISKGVSDTRKFSRLLARACRLEPRDRDAHEDLSRQAGGGELVGAAVLDLFHGIGCSTDEVLRLGASQVVTFERPEYALVSRLSSLLTRPSVLINAADDPRVLRLLCDLSTTPELEVFNLIDMSLNPKPVEEKHAESTAERIRFNAAILDPPKRKEVVEAVYSREFVTALAQHLRPGAVVACYAPDWPPWRPEDGSRKKQRKAAFAAFVESGQTRSSPAAAIGARLDTDGRVICRPCPSWAEHFMPNFLGCGFYRALPAVHTNIVRFQRVSLGS